MPNGDQYDLREQQRSKRGVVKLDPNKMETAMEVMGLSPDLMNAALESAGTIYDTRFGEDQPQFSEEDQRALDTLQGRAKQLQPTDVPAPIQGLLPGNPYAVNFRGLSQGLQNLVAAGINADKAKELYGDPDKVENLTDSMNNKLQKARELRQMAQALDMAGPAVAPGFDSSKTVNELIADAEALEETAARQAEAAEESRGVLQKARRLEEEKAEAQQAETQREEFIQKFGQQTYDQALRAEREGREQQALSERARLRETARTKRLQDELQASIKEARIDAAAEVRKEELRQSGKNKTDRQSSSWPIPARPEYVKKFIPKYLDPVEDTIDALEEELLIDGEPLPGSQDEVRLLENKPGLYKQYKNLKREQKLGRQLERDALLFEQMREDGTDFSELPTHAATSEERQQLIWMKQQGMPAELIEAWKYYNGVSLNKAPQGPAGNNNAPSGPVNMGGAFAPQGYGTGQWLTRPGQSQSNSEQ